MRRILSAVVGVCLVYSGLAAIAGPPPAWATASSLPTTLDFVGHGWGHGIGMGQYGALGYALDGWSYQEILAHYYGGTVLAQAPTNDAVVDVRLDELDGYSQITVSAAGGAQLYVNGSAVPSPYVVSREASDQVISSSGGADVVLQGPWPYGAGPRYFAGQIVLKGSEVATPQTWNVVSLEDYVEGVVPRESPASWPEAALEAQAVAARSYALASIAASGGPICDTPACQVYGGDPTQYPYSYAAASNAAVMATAGQVLDCGSDSACGPPGQIALAMYSSSTGGYTAGVLFPAVADLGDSTASNPNHSWQVSLPTAEIQAAFPAVGTLESVNVTARNGLGDLGGRVEQVQLAGSAATLEVSGSQFADALGLMSDWFTITNAAPPPGADGGYWVVDSEGQVLTFGDAPFFGSMVGRPLNAPVLGMAPTASGDGYWLVAQDGGVFSFGDAAFYGSTGGWHLNAPVIGMTSTADGHGYWLLASDGGVFSFGDAAFYGSTGGIRVPSPVVAMARTPTGHGYWLVSASGQVYPFGDAVSYGGTQNLTLNAPIVGIVPTSDGRGYWLVAKDGGIFAFGDAPFVGSLGGGGYDSIVGVTPTPDNQGYLLLSADGQVFAFGNALGYGNPDAAAGWSGGALAIFAR